MNWAIAHEAVALLLIAYFLCRGALWLGYGIGNASLFVEKAWGWMMFGLVLELMPSIIKATAWAQSKQSSPGDSGKGETP